MASAWPPGERLAGLLEGDNLDHLGGKLLARQGLEVRAEEVRDEVAVDRRFSDVDIGRKVMEGQLKVQHAPSPQTPPSSRPFCSSWLSGSYIYD
jgi:hypothetical protein